jgi:hypothetical protein
MPPSAKARRPAKPAKAGKILATVKPAAKPDKASKPTKPAGSETRVRPTPPALAAIKAPLVAPKKPAKPASGKPHSIRPRRVETPPRMKIVWEVGRSTGVTLKTFPYAEKAAAEAAVLELTRSTGKLHMLRAAKVPMGANE